MTPFFELFAARAAGRVSSAATRAKSTRTSIARDALATASDAELARAHRDATDAASVVSRNHETVNLLELKVELATRLLAPCRLCAVRCEVDRRKGPAGVCGLGAGLRRYADFLHLGEELELVPTHAIFVAGCGYRCSYCSDWDHIATPLADPETPIEEVARSIERRRAEGAASLSFVGGDPLVNAPAILASLVAADADVPLVLTTNGHATEELLDVLEGVVDAWLVDWKHGNDECAVSVARARDHVATLGRTLERVARETFVIVRHLVLPDHVECCSLPVLEAVARRAPGARVNVMAQYRPTGRVLAGPLGRRPHEDEVGRVLERARALGLRTEPLGRVVGPAPRTAAGPARPLKFESDILIDDDGKVTFENLSPDLADIARALGGDGADARWRGPPPND